MIPPVPRLLLIGAPLSPLPTRGLASVHHTKLFTVSTFRLNYPVTLAKSSHKLASNKDD